MAAIIGLLIVIGSIIGGFLIMGGPLGVLVQPSELIVIGGAGLGTVIIGTPVKMLKLLLSKIPAVVKPSPFSQEAYGELLRLQYEVYLNVKKSSWLSLEGDISAPEASTIFAKYPTFLNNHHMRDFFCDAAMMLVNGAAQPDELEMAMEAEIETHHEENQIVPGVIHKVSDAMPGLGIVAAVLGIVVTMQHIDGEPAEIGHHVAAALVGTFLGLLISYGMLGPVAVNIEKTAMDEDRYLRCIKSGLSAFANGAAPSTAVEFARRELFSFDRPRGKEFEKSLRDIRPR